MTLNDVKDNIGSAGDFVIGFAGLACVAMIFFAGSAIAFAMTTAFLSSASLLYLLLKAKDTNKLGNTIWNVCMKYRLTTDVIITFMFVGFFGTTTATALLSAGAAGVITSMLLNLLHKHVYLPEQQKIKELTKEVDYDIKPITSRINYRESAA